MHVLTQSPEQLNRHIDQAAQQLASLSTYWPPTEFVARMRAVLRPGDEVIRLGIGVVTVLRASGEVVAVYRQAT
jgi:hypothetical protein